jgi:hypothetical protein
MCACEYAACPCSAFIIGLEPAGRLSSLAAWGQKNLGRQVPVQASLRDCSRL